MNFSFQFNISDKKTQPESNLLTVETGKPDTSVNIDKATEILSNNPESASDEKKFISAKEITDLVAEQNRQASVKHKKQILSAVGCLASIILLACTIAATVTLYVLFVVPNTRGFYGDSDYLNFELPGRSSVPLMATLGVFCTGFVTSVSGIVASSFGIHRSFSNGQSQPQPVIIKA